jgi:hypothetical protein
VPKLQCNVSATHSWLNHDCADNTNTARSIANSSACIPAAMFSPEASIQSARSSLRAKRRPRASEELQQPRRKRSKLSGETFVAKQDAHPNGNGSALTNGHAEHGSAEHSLALMEMPVREKKGPPKRATKEDHGLYLVGPGQSSQTRHLLITDIS